MTDKVTGQISSLCARPPCQSSSCLLNCGNAPGNGWSRDDEHATSRLESKKISRHSSCGEAPKLRALLCFSVELSKFFETHFSHDPLGVGTIDSWSQWSRPKNFRFVEIRWKHGSKQDKNIYFKISSFSCLGGNKWSVFAWSDPWA